MELSATAWPGPAVLRASARSVADARTVGAPLWGPLFTLNVPHRSSPQDRVQEAFSGKGQGVNLCSFILHRRPSPLLGSSTRSHAHSSAGAGGHARPLRTGCWARNGILLSCVITFMLLDFFQAFRNVKTILGPWATQHQAELMRGP